MVFENMETNKRTKQKKIQRTDVYSDGVHAYKLPSFDTKTRDAVNKERTFSAVLSIEGKRSSVGRERINEMRYGAICQLIYMYTACETRESRTDTRGFENADDKNLWANRVNGL